MNFIINNIFYVSLGVVIIIEIIIFSIYIRLRFQELERLRKVSKDQDESAKMLIRRDLELSRANEKLRELDVSKSNFISVVAHQLRTPLSGIKWTLNMILNEELGPLNNDQKTFLLKGYESNDRMIGLVNDMLSADRLESGKQKYYFMPISISDLIDNVLYEFLPQADKKSISIELKNDDSLPKVFVDSDKIRAVIQNILENALKYTNNGGKILIEMKREGDFVEVSVKDNGIGIPQDQVGDIFSRFFRAKNAVKVQTDGSGLGLFITKTIVEKHGGRIWFTSEENKGSTFFFTLPIVKN